MTSYTHHCCKTSPNGSPHSVVVHVPHFKVSFCLAHCPLRAVHRNALRIRKLFEFGSIYFQCYSVLNRPSYFALFRIQHSFFERSALEQVLPWQIVPTCVIFRFTILISRISTHSDIGLHWRLNVAFEDQMPEAEK